MSVIYLLFLIAVVGCSGDSVICSVCYDLACPGTNLTLLYCATVGSNICIPCTNNCLQCTVSPLYACTGCPAPFPTNAPTPPTKAPTKAPTESPTVRPTTSPTHMPTNTPTPPIAPIDLLFAPSRAPTPPTNEPTEAPTSNPTNSPTPPTRAPTKAPTAPPPQFYECNFCNNSFPPPSLKCNDDQHMLLLLCKAYDGVSCIPCPTFCSFCFLVLAPTPKHVCTCPTTLSPTVAPTKAPTRSPTMAPTGAPTTHLPDIVSEEAMDRVIHVTIRLIVISFGCLLFILALIFCCVIPDSYLRRRIPDHEL